jgi:hypothetical protein
MSFYNMLLIIVASVVVTCAGVGGCTYTVNTNNQLYYDAMNRCTASGGSFIPTKGDDSSAICLKH